MLITKNEALKAMRDGKTVSFFNIKGIQMYLRDGFFWFDREGHEVEKLDRKTLDLENCYVIVENKHGGFKTPKANKTR